MKKKEMFVSANECRAMVEWLIENQETEGISAYIGEKGNVSVELQYIMPVSCDGKPAHMLTMVDFKDPYDGEPHGYPKLYIEGEFDALYAELQREWNYIKDIHKVA